MHFFWSQHVATMDWCTYPVTQHLTSRFLWDTAVILQLRPQTTIGVTSTPRTPRRHLSWAVTGKHVGQFLWSKANQPYSMLFNPRLCNGVYICFHMFPHVSTVWTSKRAGLSDHASQNGWTMRALPSPQVRTCASSMLQGLSLQPQHSKTRSDKWWNDMNCI